MVSLRENGVFRSYRINGVPALNIVLIPILGVMLHAAVCAAIIALTAGPLFGAALPLRGHEMAGVGIFLALARRHFPGDEDEGDEHVCLDACEFTRVIVRG